MSRTTLYRAVRWMGGAVVAVLASVSVAQAQQSSITVRVTEAGTNRPIEQAQVAIAGSLVGGLTNPEDASLSAVCHKARRRSGCFA